MFRGLFAFHISTINFNHFNQTLNRPAPTGTGRHVPAQELLLFSFCIASFPSDQQEDFLFAYLAALAGSFHQKAWLQAYVLLV